MRIARAESAGRVGVLDERGLRLLPAGYGAVDALLASDDELDRLADRPSSVAPGDLGAPVDGLTSMRDCVGFLDHIRHARAARDMREPLPAEWNARPAFYFANPSSVRSSTASIARPPGSSEFDFELEIAAVIGRSGRDLTADEAHGFIAGYVLYCDWSARDIQAEERVMQIGQGKGKDSAISLGPWVLRADAADEWRRPDGFDFPVSVEIDGAPVVETRFLGMDWSFEELVAYASVGADIAPGDLVASGTVPWGCLLEHSSSPTFRGWLRPGETVRITAGPLGEILTTITDGAPVSRWRRMTPAQSGSAQGGRR